MRRDRRHPAGPGAAAHWLPTLLVLALLGCAVGAYRYDWGPRYLGWYGDEPTRDPAAIAPPAGLEFPTWHATRRGCGPRRLAPRVDSARPSRPPWPAGLAGKMLGKHVVAAVGDAGGDGAVWIHDDDQFVPGLDHQAADQHGRAGRARPRHEVHDPGRGGREAPPGRARRRWRPLPVQQAADPRGDSDGLSGARRHRHARPGTARALRAGASRSRWSTTTRSSPAPPTTRSGVPTTSRTTSSRRSPRCGSTAARPRPATARATTRPSRRPPTFASALQQAGVKVDGTPTTAASPPRTRRARERAGRPGGQQIVERLLDVSDNETAEVLAHHVGLAVSGDGSFVGGAAGVLTTLQSLGIETGLRRRATTAPASRASTGSPRRPCCRCSRSRHGPTTPSSALSSPVSRWPGSPARSPIGSPPRMPRRSATYEPRRARSAA